MKLKQLIIKTKVSDVIQLQKYLFSFGYYWDDAQRNHQLKKFNTSIINMKYIYIITGKSCDMKYKTMKDMELLDKNVTEGTIYHKDIANYKRITYDQLIRKQKLKK
jgi:hypothetical protein